MLNEREIIARIFFPFCVCVLVFFFCLAEICQNSLAIAAHGNTRDEKRNAQQLSFLYRCIRECMLKYII